MVFLFIMVPASNAAYREDKTAIIMSDVITISMTMTILLDAHDSEFADEKTMMIS